MASSTADVEEIPGVTVTDIDIDIPAGLGTVRGESVDDDAVRAAIVEAGYEVTQTVQGAAA